MGGFSGFRRSLKGTVRSCHAVFAHTVLKIHNHPMAIARVLIKPTAPYEALEAPLLVHMAHWAGEVGTL